MSNIHKPSKCFALKILDDSMKPDFVEGDMIVIDSELRPAPGEFVVARIDKEIFFRLCYDDFWYFTPKSRFTE